MYSYLITFDLPIGGNHDAMVEAIKVSGRWWHYLANTWIVTTPYTAAQMFEVLRPHLVVSDRVLIVEIHAHDQRQGWLSQAAWDWLRSNLAG